MRDGILQDAFLKGFDTVKLKDGCRTIGPEYKQLSAEYNSLTSFGFLYSCKDLAEAVDRL
ncbi:hypothetical protein DL95DRAFT_159565 [Leptodontidium sp. 2 PMI_412]|nr:hypothetical protein DL95DRAFT_159565 [Leptodontidium sp. 2 PMI_412]